jgi:predicted amidohydrolase
MAYTGYKFRDREDIRPLLEDLSGPTVEWCRFQAQRLHCSVVCGFPRREKAVRSQHPMKSHSLSLRSLPYQLTAPTVR